VAYEFFNFYFECTDKLTFALNLKGSRNVSVDVTAKLLTGGSRNRVDFASWGKRILCSVEHPVRLWGPHRSFV
jgi:hypothetical protein